MISGLLLLNKPVGITSHQLVHQVRKILHQKKVGHCGTLDPEAQGLMVLLLGKACSLSQYLLSKDKRYELTMKLGEVTETGDRSGKTISKVKNFNLDKKLIEKTLKESVGEFDLEVPSFSAIKYKGKRLYKYARQGCKTPPIKRKMYFYDLSIQSIYKDEVQVRLSCQKGGYIRSWSHFVGTQLEVGAHLVYLKRVASFPYFLDQSTSVEELKKDSLIHQNTSFFIPISQSLTHIPSVGLDLREEELFCHGQIPYSCQERWSKERIQEIFRVMNSSGERLLGLVHIDDLMKPCILKVFS